MMAGDITRRPGWLGHDQAAAGRTVESLALWRAVHDHDVVLSARRHVCRAFGPGFMHREGYSAGKKLETGEPQPYSEPLALARKQYSLARCEASDERLVNSTRS
jgi:hypothetical protein